MAKSMAQFHDIWVITRANNKSLIEEELRERPIHGLHFIFYDLPKWLMGWKRGGRGVQLYYYLWQLGIGRVCRRAHERIGFDVSHHLTFGKYWVPSMLSFLPVPFIWGPVGGGESMPRAFWKELSPRAFIFEWSRSIARAIGEHDYLVRKTAKNSVVSLATTQETALRLRRIGCSDVQEMAQCALNQNQRELLLADVDGDGHKGIRFLSIGRALHWKGFDLGLRAFAEADLPSSEYWLLVNGSGRVSLERLANELGIAEKVTFLEPVGSLEEVYGIIKSCDVLVHPALHEAFGNVVQEAMAAKVPVICLDIGGPATQVMSQFGYCAKSKNPQVAISSIKEAMIELSGNRDVLKEMGEAARSHTIKNMRWERLAENLSSIYCQISVNEHRL